MSNSNSNSNEKTANAKQILYLIGGATALVTDTRKEIKPIIIEFYKLMKKENKAPDDAKMTELLLLLEDYWDKNEETEAESKE